MDREKDSGKPERLLNLGPKSQALLRRLGIESLEGLKAAGAVATYRAAQELEERVSLNLLWALEGAVTGRPWQEVARTERDRLLSELDGMS